MNSGHDEAGLRCDLIGLALSEDLGDRGDVTSQTFIPSASTSFARIVAREECIVSGLSTALEVFRRIDPRLEVTLRCSEGERLSQGATLIELKGSTRSILSGERTALNFLGRLCGIATLSARYAEKARGTRAVLLDTRKTTPGWRLLEKQAVKAGGCTNHRMGLHDAVLVKDNHLAALGSLDALQTVISNLRAEHPSLPIEVEADTLEQVERLLTMTGIDVILLDNMDATMMRKALTLRNTLSPAVLLEASGGVTLETLRQIADTGVDRISVGALTHSAPNADLSMELGHAV
jgi:nicotinate-nucleotide pyrophosphorylase (carboxylating)